MAEQSKDDECEMQSKAAATNCKEMEAVTFEKPESRHKVLLALHTEPVHRPGIPSRSNITGLGWNFYRKVKCDRTGA
jgi:hypothetical protein